MKLILAGLNHRTAPVALREQLALADCGLRMALEDLGAGQTSSAQDNGKAPEAKILAETVILSTCNRLEVYGVVAGNPAAGWRAIEQYLARLQGVPLAQLHPHLYFKKGREAAVHLMRVAAGLDSMVLGEPQILGQVAVAQAEAQRARTSGPVLSHLYDLASHAGKRARSETGIGRHTTSISHAAANLIQEQVGDLSQVDILVVGAGEMAEVAGHALQDRGAWQMRFINRTYARAEDLARQFNGQALNWYHLPDALAMADVVVTATGAPHIVIHENDVQPVLPERSGRPLLLVDIAVPRDVEESVGDLPGVQRYDVDHFQSVVDANLAQRQAAIPNVETIIHEEADRFESWLQGRQVVPVLVELRSKVRAIADEELARAQHRLDELDPESQEQVNQIVHRIINKLLHEPTVRLKASAGQGNGVLYAQAVRELFDLGLNMASNLAANDPGNGQLPTGRRFVNGDGQPAKAGPDRRREHLVEE